MGKAYLPCVHDASDSLSASTNSLFGTLKGGVVTVCALILQRFDQPYLDSGKLVQTENREPVVSQPHYFVHTDSNENPRKEIRVFREWLLQTLDVNC